MKYIIKKALTLLLVLCVAQLIGAQAHTIEQSQQDFEIHCSNVEHNESDDSIITPKWPTDAQNLDEHLTGEEVSEEEMLSGRKTSQLNTRIPNKLKGVNNKTQKPSNESLGILSPPPKA